MEVFGFSPWVRPFIISELLGGMDSYAYALLGETLHQGNRRSCAKANAENALIAQRYGNMIKPPFWHYDALSGRAIEVMG